MVKFIEFFSGSRSVSQVAMTLGCDTLSIDRDIIDGVNWNVSVKDVTVRDIKDRFGVPQIGWFSPPCNIWSKLNWWRHWDRYIYKRSRLFVPATKMAANGMECITATIDYILDNQDMIFFIENPEGLLSKHPVIQRLAGHKDVSFITRFTVTYCKYGFPHRKPTHIWTNCRSWSPAVACKRNDLCHIASPRSMQPLHAIKGRSFDRSTIPSALALECITAALCDVAKVCNNVTSLSPDVVHQVTGS